MNPIDKLDDVMIALVCVENAYTKALSEMNAYASKFSSGDEFFADRDAQGYCASYTCVGYGNVLTFARGVVGAAPGVDVSAEGRKAHRLYAVHHAAGLALTAERAKVERVLEDLRARARERAEAHVRREAQTQG